MATKKDNLATNQKNAKKKIIWQYLYLKALNSCILCSSHWPSWEFVLWKSLHMSPKVYAGCLLPRDEYVHTVGYKAGAGKIRFIYICKYATMSVIDLKVRKGSCKIMCIVDPIYEVEKTCVYICS